MNVRRTLHHDGWIFKYQNLYIDFTLNHVHIFCASVYSCQMIRLREQVFPNEIDGVPHRTDRS